MKKRDFDNHRDGKYCRARVWAMLTKGAGSAVGDSMTGKHAAGKKKKGKKGKKRQGLQQATRRLDNIKRSLARNLPPFARFVASTRRQQRKQKGAIFFIPFGGSDWRRCADVKAVSAVVRRSLATAGGQQAVSTKSLLATAAATGVLWTTRWARLLGIVPVPMGGEYRNELVEGMMRDWACGEALHNNRKQVTNARSFLNLTRPLARQRASQLADMVARLAENAEAAEEAWPNWEKVALCMGTKGVPATGFSMKYMRLVAVSVRPSLAGEAPLGDVSWQGRTPLLSLASGALAGLQRLTGLTLSANGGKLPQRAWEYLLKLVDAELRRQCAEARCEHKLADLCGVLCSWSHNGYPQQVAEYECMRGALRG